MARPSFAGDDEDLHVSLTPVLTGRIEIDDETHLANTPLAGVPHPDGSMLIVHQSGMVSRLAPGSAKLEPWVDLTGLLTSRPLPKWPFGPAFADERGLLGLALHPQFDDSESAFHNVYYVAFTGGPPADFVGLVDNVFVVAQLRFEGPTKHTVKTILEIDQPQPNHNGGPLLFGPAAEDARSGIGYLYISVGDGGGMNDEHGELLDPADPSSFLGNGQDLTTLLGKVLCIDANYGIGDDVRYTAPSQGWPDGREEIFAYGLRNVWGMSLDAPTGRIFAADVGQNTFEEINILKNGANYGWRGLEGGARHDFGTDNVFNRPVFEHMGGLDATEPPIIHYDRSERFPSAVIGGHVYRGNGIPVLNGAYVFGDYRGDVFYAKEDNDGVWRMKTLIPVLLLNSRRLHAIMQMGDGELMLSFADDDAHTTYTLYKLVTLGLSGDDIASIHAAVAEASRATKSDIRAGEEIPEMYSAVVLHEGGEADVARTSDDAWIGSRDIARAKAFTALGFSSSQNAMSTRTIGALSQTGPWSQDPSPLWGIGTTNPERGVVQFPGGIPLYKNGRLVGGLGVSGDAVDVDEAVARAAVRAVGLEAPVVIRNEPFFKAETPLCALRGCSNEGTLRCVGCKKESYCSESCQSSDWTEHRANCVEGCAV